MTFDITIPVLNEAPSLARQVGILHDFVSRQFPDLQQWRIVIADNGSTDHTFEIARELERNYHNIIPLIVSRKGVGLALKTSWSQSSADIVGYMDLDLATDLSHFPQAYHAIAHKGCDLVYASRLHPQSKVINRPLKREIASRVFNFIVSTYLQTGFSDGMCGFKFLRRKVYPSLYQSGARNDGWFFSTELLTVAEWLDLRLCELPVRWTDDVSSSRVRIIPLAKRYLQDMVQLKKHKPGS